MKQISTGTLPPGRFHPSVVVLRSKGAAPATQLVLRQPLGTNASSDRTALEFRKHEKLWLRDTMFHSSPIDRYLHPSYARIIGLGWAAVPYVLRSLKRKPNDWFYALRAITGENPVPDSMAGDIVQMAEVWINWGKARSLI